LAVVAIVSFRKENRLVAVLTGVGAAVLGYTAVVGSSSSDDEAETDATDTETDTTVTETDTTDTTDTTASDPADMRCEICGEPIVVGQSRRPNSDNEIVHESCLDTAE
jgi:hypothetical protein